MREFPCNSALFGYIITPVFSKVQGLFSKKICGRIVVMPHFVGTQEVYSWVGKEVYSMLYFNRGVYIY